MKRPFLRFTRLVHKWGGLLLAIQITCWIAGGVVMSVLPLDKVHGDHLVTRNLPDLFAKIDYSYSVDKILATLPASVRQIELTRLVDRAIYRITTDDGVALFDAKNGELIDGIDAKTIAEVAKAHYLGDGSMINVELIDFIPQEVSFKGKQIWRVEYEDAWSSTLYFSPSTGEFISVRSNMWRVFDFFWMLHIMDYDERENINNPLLITFSLSAFFFTLSGIVLLFQSFRFKRRRSRNNY